MQPRQEWDRVVVSSSFGSITAVPEVPGVLFDDKPDVPQAL